MLRSTSIWPCAAPLARRLGPASEVLEGGAAHIVGEAQSRPTVGGGCGAATEQEGVLHHPGLLLEVQARPIEGVAVVVAALARPVMLG